MTITILKERKKKNIGKDDDLKGEELKFGFFFI